MEPDNRPIGLRKKPAKCDLVRHTNYLVRHQIRGFKHSGNATHSGVFLIHNGALSGDQKWQMANYCLVRDVDLIFHPLPSNLIS